MKAKSPVAKLLGEIPNRLQLAGGWIDQPFVSRHNPEPPGSMVVVQIEPNFLPMDRSGIASGTRAVAMGIWKGKLPNRPRDELMRELYNAENRGKNNPSGSQDMIGVIYPGINRLDYDFNIHGGVFPSHIESCNRPKVARWLEKVLQLIPVGPRPHGYNPLGKKNLSPKWVAKLGESGKMCFDAIVKMDAEKLGVVDQPNGQPTASIFYSTNIAGPWQSHQLNVGAFDPGLYIETNGIGYIVTAGGWQSNTTFLTLNSSFSQVVASTTIANGLGLEGSHIYKVGNYYYIFNSQPATGNFYVSRAPGLFGPYTFMYTLNNNTGGHQGGIVDMPDGSYYGFVMKDSGTIGRMTYISPIFWSNGWPVWGTANAPGKVPATAPLPIVGAPDYKIPTSDDFSSPTLGLQWQFNHNPDNTRWSLTARPGFLRLHPTAATNFWYARNTLIQKGQGPWSGAEVEFDLSNLQSGDICGLGALGKSNATIAVTYNGPGNYTLSQNMIVSLDSSKTNLSTTTVITAPYTNTTIFLRLGMDFIKSTGTVLYSTNGLSWTQLGGKFNIAYDWLTGTFQGEQFTIFCYNPQPGTGYLDVDWFRFTPPAFINGIIQNPDSSMTLHFASSPGFTNIIQASTDFNTWQNVSTNIGDSNGFWQFTDTNANPASVQFYRSYTP